MNERKLGFGQHFAHRTLSGSAQVIVFDVLGGPSFRGSQHMTTDAFGRESDHRHKGEQ
nr:hypothetical protein JVH1_3102 [Rhodococcus sp. JVH1]